MDESLVAWHAGDGTGTKFQWLNTGVKATSNTKPIFAVVENSSVSSGYSYSVNGETTNIEAPGNYRLTFYGPTWKIENGYYYMGNTYYNSDYKYISSRGGNLNSIGIESACNYGSDLWMTYHITAQLVARLLDKSILRKDTVNKIAANMHANKVATLLTDVEVERIQKNVLWAVIFSITMVMMTN